VSTRIGNNIEQCKTTNDLRRTFGPPIQIIDNGNAGEVWVYSETWVKTNPGIIIANNNTATWRNPSTIEYDKYIKFWIDGERIYRSESKGHPLKKLSGIGWVFYIIGCAGVGYLIGDAIGGAIGGGL
jgi:hypothetical protein